MTRVGENTAYMDGPEYEKVRPKYREAYKGLVKELVGK
jgi:hypothetical protein